MKARLFFHTTLSLVLLSSLVEINAQTAYWVRFTDKDGIDQPINDQYSQPVSKEYLKQIEDLNIVIVGTSNWLNLALVRTSPRQLKALRNRTFIKDILPVQTKSGKFAQRSSTQPDHSSIREKQIGLFEYDTLEEMGLSGKGIRIAVFDGGFPGVDTHPGFQHLIKQNKIIATWNFPDNSPNVFGNHHHGTAVLSCIAGKKDGKPTGLAPDAEFLLARTELPGEPWREQLYWIQAAEWAEQNGANIICSALGYTYQHYFPENMDGESPVAEAARIATSKGILVVNSIGNDGDTKWKIASTPADAIEVLGVGGIDPNTGLKASFSSFGPNAAGELKPNLVAPSTVIAATPKGWKVMYGTSFAAPLVAGFAACMWELHPELNNIEIFNLMQKSGNLYPYYDYAHGYGVPQADRMNKINTLSSSVGISVRQEEDSVIIRIIEPPSPSNPYLYYHLARKNGTLLEYQVVKVNVGEEIAVNTEKFPQLSNICIRFGQTYKNITIKDENK